MKCEHLSGDVCGVASAIVGYDAPTTPAACDQCDLQLEPRAKNFVTACLACAAVMKKDGKDAWRRTRIRLAGFLVMNREMTEKAKQLKLTNSGGVECEQNVGGICVVASHLAEQPVEIDKRCHQCKDLADWRMPNLVTAGMAIDHRRDLEESYQCYTSSDGQGVGAHVKAILYELGVRGLRRCEMDVVERMNWIGISGCRRIEERLGKMLVGQGEAGGWQWVFEQMPASVILSEAISRTEQCKNGTTREQDSSSNN